MNLYSLGVATLILYGVIMFIEIGVFLIMPRELGFVKTIGHILTASGGLVLGIGILFLFQEAVTAIRHKKTHNTKHEKKENYFKLCRILRFRNLKISSPVGIKLNPPSDIKCDAYKPDNQIKITEKPIHDISLPRDKDGNQP